MEKTLSGVFQEAISTNTCDSCVGESEVRRVTQLQQIEIRGWLTNSNSFDHCAGEEGTIVNCSKFILRGCIKRREAERGGRRRGERKLAEDREREMGKGREQERN
jgi:hypothetical protein